LKTDRARIQVGRISGFGLLEMSRQRLRPGMLEATTQPCPSCHGTGLIRSDDSLALTILRTLEEEGTRKRSKEVLLKAPIAVVNYLMNAKREHIAQIEARYGMSVRIEADPHKVSPDFDLEKFKTATRVVQAVTSNVISMDSHVDMSDVVDDIEETAEADVAEAAPAVETDDEDKPKRKRRRRRGGRGRNRNNGENREDGGSEEQKSAGDVAPAAANDDDDPRPSAAEVEAGAAPVDATGEVVAEEAPKKSRTRTRRPKKDEAEVAVTEEAAVVAEVVAEEPAEKPKRKRAPRKTAAQKAAELAEAGGETETAAPAAEAPAEKPKRTRKPAAKKAAAVEEPVAVAEAAPEEAPVKKKRVRKSSASVPADVVAEPVPAQEAPLETKSSESSVAEADKPKRKGWWSLGRG
jgi:ribonuclease E